MDRRQLLKTLSLSFLPIIVYIIADSLWGLKIGLIVAVISGFVEFALVYLKERKLEYFIFFDILLLAILGLISYFLHDDIFFRLKPAFMNGIFIVLLFISGFTDNPILMDMALRRFRDVQISEEQISEMRRITRILFFVFILHTVLIVYSAYALSVAWWGFISGGLFYILTFGTMAVLWLQKWFNRKRLMKQYLNSEWFDLVTPEGNIIGKAPREVAHGNPKLLHPVVHLQIVRSNGDLFLQKRAELKSVQPGKWDTAVGGHVRSGESIEAALIREANEELGIAVQGALPIARYVWSTDFESELVYVFKLKYDGPFELNPAEITEGKFWKRKQIESGRNDAQLTPNFLHEYRILSEAGLL